MLLRFCDGCLLLTSLWLKGSCFCTFCTDNFLSSRAIYVMYSFDEYCCCNCYYVIIETSFIVLVFYIEFSSSVLRMVYGVGVPSVLLGFSEESRYVTATFYAPTLFKL